MSGEPAGKAGMEPGTGPSCLPAQDQSARLRAKNAAMAACGSPVL
jgi:hypothetical protein